ncbi:MAG: class I SAM-dependent methyltransferase [Chloroflexales bacterium]|nr:class I SAM-dependent methyltransferase [Chloroflexales bacterium]
MNDWLLDLLRCPSSGERFSFVGKEGYGVLRSSAGRYPVVEGIPILKRGLVGNMGRTVADVLKLVEAGRRREALLALILPRPPAVPVLAPPWVQALPEMRGLGRLKTLAHGHALGRWREHAAVSVLRTSAEASAWALLDFYFRGSGMGMPNAYDYFAYRFGLPDFLAALGYAAIIERPRRPLLDLACGFGHITRSLVRRAAPQPVVAADRVFFTLHLARSWVAPEAHYICCDADVALPFASETFAVAFCADAFHYFGDKATAISELKRLIGAEGTLIMTRLRNALFQGSDIGQPLMPEGYMDLVADRPHRLASDSATLARYLRKQGPALAAQSDLELLCQEKSLSLVVGAAPILRDYDTFAQWPHAEGRLALNPLYTAHHDGSGTVLLQRTFPSQSYEESYANVKSYLPSQVTVAEAVLEELARGERSAAVEELVEQFVALDIPPRYC